MQNDIRKIMSLIKPNQSTNCWEWQGALNKGGYGRYHCRKTDNLVHRLSYEFFIGKIAKDKCLDHLCRNRRCANPYHLEQVTNWENVKRGLSPIAKNARKTHCIHGHSLSGENLYLRFGKWRICLTCRRRYNRESMVRQYARKFYLSQT